MDLDPSPKRIFNNQHIVIRYRDENRIENKLRLPPNKIDNVRGETWILEKIRSSFNNSLCKYTLYGRTVY